MMTRFSIPVLIGLLLGGCVQPSVQPGVPPDPVPPATEDTCGASGYGRLIGQDATALERELIMREIRVIRPGMAVTMDFRSTRINFSINDANRIDRVFCG